tara:strand:+ start:1384 stop:1998 length:615 start_codon:yes stop_codon:yes gene_type:complete
MGKINIPVYIFSYDKNRRFAEATKKDLQKYFSNVNIYYGLNVKSKENTENILPRQVLHYNLQKFLEEKNITKPFIYAEDDVRITRGKELHDYLKGGIKGNINRLVYVILRDTKVGGTQMVGIKNPQDVLKRLQNTRRVHIDNWFDKHYPNQVISPNFGINYANRPSAISPTGEQWQKSMITQTKLFDEGERENIPIANKRYRKK